ncbi:MAG: ribose-5-phosphate isomerase RpiA [Candidatus Tectomicrobia bacterium]|nr:ribose-5-phosphate isomerase RpiA [Candidatus Tectomicrobia bacterium]
MSDRPPDPQQLLKAAVGRDAAARVASGSVVGLGTGSTAAFAVEHLGNRLRSGDVRDVRGVATSFDAAALARRHGIPLTTLDDAPHIHLAIDGADEVDPDLALIKGGGAAHTQEKIVDAQADLFIVIVDDTKLVQQLGSTFAVPVEVLPMAVAPVWRSVENLGGRPQLRMGARKIGPLITDQGNMLLDVTFDAIDDAAHLERALNNIPGAVENGLFVGLADLVLVGELVDGEPRVRELSRPAM